VLIANFLLAVVQFNFSTHLSGQKVMKISSQASTGIVRNIGMQMVALRSPPLMAVLSLFLLFAQTVEKRHSHEADLQLQFDCEICLKGGSLDDIIVADAPNLSLPTTHQTFPILSQNQIFFKPARAFARGPPSYI
jgi:uncharacterized membrane protein